MPFQINGNPFVINACHPYKGEHTWIYSGGDTVSIPNDDQLCTCGAFKYKEVYGIDEETQEIIDASIEDFWKFENEE